MTPAMVKRREWYYRRLRELKPSHRFRRKKHALS